MLLVNRCHVAGLKSTLPLSNIRLIVCIDDEKRWEALSVTLMSLDIVPLVLIFFASVGLMLYSRNGFVTYRIYRSLPVFPVWTQKGTMPKK